MINLLKSTIEDFIFLFFRCEVERIAVVWWAAKKKKTGSGIAGAKKKKMQSFQSIHHLIKAAKVRHMGDCSIENIMCARGCLPGEHF